MLHQFAAKTQEKRPRPNITGQASASRAPGLCAGGDKAEFQELHEAYEKIMEQRRSSLADLVLFQESARLTAFAEQ